MFGGMQTARRTHLVLQLVTQIAKQRPRHIQFKGGQLLDALVLDVLREGGEKRAGGGANA